MYGLVYKELILNRKNLLILLGVDLYMFIMGIFITSSMLSDGILSGSSIGMSADIVCSVLTAIVFLFTLIMQPSIFSSDESKRWCAYVTSSPAGERGQIYSKYMFSYVMLLVTDILCYFGSIAICTNVSVQYGSEVQIGLSTNVGFYAFLLVIFFDAVEFPFYVRFGSRIGSSVKMGIFFGILFIVVVYLLFGDLSAFGSLDDLWAFLERVIKGGAFGEKLIFLFGLGSVLAFVLYILSYKLSCRLYLKGAENFEK